MLKQRIDQELKKALLEGNKTLVTTLRGLKSVILYAEVAKGNRDQGLSDEDILVLFAKESKKRQESADLYIRGGSRERADAELEEKRIIDAYLPKQLDDDELGSLVDAAISETGATGPQAMGQVIAAVKQRAEGQADGGRIAAMVKERLANT
jgi:uncharacterized protein YqeY